MVALSTVSHRSATCDEDGGYERFSAKIRVEQTDESVDEHVRMPRIARESRCGSQ